jgi:glycosyltransferase involved in cell wall biosynthesis
MNETIWLTWDRHRRTQEMAAALNVPVVRVSRGSKKWMDPVWPSVATVRRLFERRPKTVITQNPSLLLTAIVCAFKKRLGYRVIQDLHSYFFQHMDRPSSIRGRVYRALSRYCLRRADLTIVTNEALRALAEAHGGRGFVLQDKLPNLDGAPHALLPGVFNVVFICTYSDDEPVAEVIEAARLAGDDVFVHITGRPGKMALPPLPRNVRLTGFLPDRDYVGLLSSCDAVLALTTRDNTLLCGAYEAVALGKPLVLSDFRVLHDYFSKGAVPVGNDALSLLRGLRQARAEHARLKEEILDLASDLRDQWQERFSGLAAMVHGQPRRRELAAAAGNR